MTIKRRDLLTGGAGIAAGMAAGGLPGPARAQGNAIQWDREADVVIIGSGATGLPAAIVAREGGSSVIVVEAQSHIGGHAICSGGNMPLGGGTSVQKSWRHPGLARPGVPGPDRLVGGRAQRLSRLPLQRPRGDPRLRRQLRARRSNSCSSTASCSSTSRRTGRRQLGRQFGAARNARGADGLAADPDRPAGRSGRARDHVDRQRPDAAARRRGTKRPGSKICSSTG